MSRIPIALIVCLVAYDLGARLLLAAIIGVGVAHALRSKALIRALGVMRPAPDALVRAVAEQAALRGVRAPETVELRWSPANAFVIQSTRAPIVAFTRGALLHMTHDELAAIAHHELEHVAERRGVRIVRMIMGHADDVAFVVAAMFTSVFSVAAAYGFGLLYFVYRFSVAPSLFRRFEARADHAGTAHEKEHGAYGRALLRMYELNAIPLVLAGKGTHGHAYDRAVASGVVLETRPKAPPSGVALVVIVIIVLIAVIGAKSVASPLLSCGTESECTRAVVLSGGAGSTFFDLATCANDPAASTTFYRAAVAANPDDAEYPLLVARTLAIEGECGEARAMMAIAEARWKKGESRSPSSTRGVVDHCRSARSGVAPNPSR